MRSNVRPLEETITSSTSMLTSSTGYPFWNAHSQLKYTLLLSSICDISLCPEMFQVKVDVEFRV